MPENEKGARGGRPTGDSGSDSSSTDTTSRLDRYYDQVKPHAERHEVVAERQLAEGAWLIKFRRDNGSYSLGLVLQEDDTFAFLEGK